MVVLPEGLIRNNRQARGAEGIAWLDGLPTIIADLTVQWSLQVQMPFPLLSFNYVAPATRQDGTPVVLKLSPPHDREFRQEAEALRIFAGRGMVHLLEVDLERGAMLLEQLDPGKPLHTLRDDPREISIAVDIMRQLWRPVPEHHRLVTVAEWGESFARHRREHGGSGPLPRDVFERGEALYRELDASASERMVLHGDLHQGNILAAQRQPWLAIDPKGIVGEPAYEVGPLLRNMWEDLYDVPDRRRTLVRRFEQVVEQLGFDRERVRGYGIATNVLSAVWSAENGGTDWDDALQCVEILADL